MGWRCCLLRYAHFVAARALARAGAAKDLLMSFVSLAIGSQFPCPHPNCGKHLDANWNTEYGDPLFEGPFTDLCPYCNGEIQFIAHITYTAYAITTPK